MPGLDLIIGIKFKELLAVQANGSPARGRRSARSKSLPANPGVTCAPAGEPQANGPLADSLHEPL